MKTSPISRISASIPNTKKSKFNLNHDVNTTYDWGSVQPLFGKLMLPDSSINVNCEQLTRLAPMPVPTFGRVKMKNVVHFVSCQDIWPNWQAMLSQTKVTRGGLNGSETYVPKRVPYINTNILAAFCLAGSRFNVYFSGPVSGMTKGTAWYCARNTNTTGFASPTPWQNATYAVRGFLYGTFGLDNSSNPSTVSLPDFNNYTGYSFNARRLCLDRNGQMLVSSNNCPFLVLPTVSTTVSVPMAGSVQLDGYTHSAGNELLAYDNLTTPVTVVQTKDNHITFSEADMIWEYRGSDPSQGISSADRASNSGGPLQGSQESFFDGRYIRVVFKLSSFGKRLRKILIGLGYNVNLSDDTNVSLLPLLAFYKAWWDTYAPERYCNFYETPAWKLINQCMISAAAPVILSNVDMTSSNNYTMFFRQFMSDLGTCFATEKLDAVSAATDNYYAGSNTTQNVLGESEIQNSILATINKVLGTGLSTTENNVGTDAAIDSPNNITGNGANFNGFMLSSSSGGSLELTQPQIDALKKCYNMINKSSVAGQRVEEILRSLGLGDYIEECKGRFISGNDDPIKISDVVATAATDDAALGQYGGRGLGVDRFQFSFKAQNHGYLIILSAIVPESGYVNAPSKENEVVSFQSLYNPEFDGLAYEAIQKKCLLGSPLINDPSCNDTFGFLPTYSQWKFMSNKSNGDFSLNSKKNSLTPYTLDKLITADSVKVTEVEDSPTYPGTTIETCDPVFRYSDLPNAGEEWRYVNKYPWNGNFNRIFMMIGDGLDWNVYSPNNSAFLYNSYEADNFLTHNVFDITYHAHMKSIEDSYGTYDEEHGAPNTSIKKS